MNRLVYSLDSATTALAAIRELRAIPVPDECIHLVARSDVELEQIPDKFIEDSTDFGPAVARGAALGGTAGLVGGLVAASFPVLGITLGGGALLLGIAGAAVGAWSSSLMGAATPSQLRRDFEDEIEKRGRVLLAVHARDERERVAIENVLAAFAGNARRMTVQAAAA